MPEAEFTLSKETRHYLAYVPWRTILDWRREEIKAGRRHKGSELKPYAYATRIKHAFDHLRAGDMIWIFTIPYYGKFSSFPSLNAMLVIEDQLDRVAEQDRKRLGKVPAYFNAAGEQKQWRYIFFGNQEFSRYYPINNCLEQIRPLLPDESALKLEAGQHNGYGFLGMIFQRARQISPESGAQLFEFQQRLQRHKTLFISYRHREEPEVVGKVIESLLKAGIVCWLDLNRIPRGVSKDLAKKPDAFFKAELIQAVKACNGLLAIESEAYWQSFWTGLEYGAAKALTAQKNNFQLFETNLSMLKRSQERQQLIDRINQSNKFSIISEN